MIQNPVNTYAMRPLGKIACPACGGLASREQRTFGDRLLSLIRPVKRYACSHCEWTGVIEASDAVPFFRSKTDRS